MQEGTAQTIDVLINLDLTKFPTSNLPGFDARSAILVRSGICIGRIPQATQEGHAAAAIIARLPDGQYVIIETTLRLFGAAAGALQAAENESRHEQAAGKN